MDGMLKIFIFMSVAKMILINIVYSRETSFLHHDYDKRIRPNKEKGKTLEIAIDLFIESFGRVDEAKMEFEAYGYIMQTWKDERLNLSNNTPIILEGHDTNVVWLPDIYCVNCRKSNLYVGKNNKENMIRIDRNSSIYFSNGITLIATCKMDLKKFPFDTQKCEIQFCSYAYDINHIVYSWSSNAAVKLKKLDELELMSIDTRVKDENYTSGKFRLAIATFTFERRSGFYILQIFLPTAMLVALSWMTFGLDHRNAGERLTIGITLFLTMIFLHGYANTSLPRVSYIKLLDVYMVVSVTAILLAIIESVIICRMQFTEERLNSKMRSSIRNTSNGKGDRKITPSNHNGASNADIIEKNNKENHSMLDCDDFMDDAFNEKTVIKILSCKGLKNGPTKKSCKKIDRSMKPAKIDRIFSFLLPISYILFNVWFWNCIIQQEQSHKHH